jgi:hypothetical protein
MAQYLRKANKQYEFIDCRGSDLPMNDVAEVEAKLGLLRFIKAGGEQGWELCSTIAPWPEGQRLNEQNEDGTGKEEYLVENRFPIQWLIFKRPVR